MASPFYKYIFPRNLLGQDSGALSPSIISFDTVRLRAACNSWGICMAHPSPREDWCPEDGASGLHMGQTCRNKGTSQLAQVLTTAVGAAALAGDTHCGTFLQKLDVKNLPLYVHRDETPN